MRLTRRSFLALCASIPLLSKGLVPSARADETTLTLRGRVLSPDGARFFPGEIRLCGPVINAVEPAPFPAREPKNILDLGDAHILPGVINAHLHNAHSPEERRSLFLAQGVTTVCDMGAPLTALPLLSEDATPSGLPTASAIFAGPVLTIPGAYPAPLHGAEYALAVSGPAQARQGVEQLRELGASIIKIALEPGYPSNPWPVPDAAFIRAVTETAHSLGMLVRAHVEDLSVLSLAVDNQVDAVEHTCFRWTEDNREKPLFTGDPDNPDIPESYLRCLRRMADNGIAMVPTLEAATRSLWNNAGPLAVIRRFKEMGGRIALGTDYPFQGVSPGMPLREMELLGEAGLSPRDILLAATREAAAVCNAQDELGILAPGARADLIVVQGDPLADPAALARPLLVLKNGRIAFDFRSSRSA